MRANFVISSSSVVLCFHEKHRGRKLQSLFREVKAQEVSTSINDRIAPI